MSRLESHLYTLYFHFAGLVNLPRMCYLAAAERILLRGTRGQCVFVKFEKLFLVQSPEWNHRKPVTHPAPNFSDLQGKLQPQTLSGNVALDLQLQLM